MKKIKKVVVVDDSRKIAVKLAQIADKKKAEDIVILNVRKLTFITDAFMIMSVKNKKQAQAIALDMAAYAKNEGITNLGLEGYEEGNWVLVDFGSVVIHIFNGKLREFYDLESLWGDATKIKWKR
jgi:ribosome-associated protein